MATASILIPYILGYRFNMERGIFIYTGSISIKTSVQNVSVSIDKQAFDKGRLNFMNGSYHIGGINPGEHLLEITAPDFQPWSKKVAVTSGLSSEFWNIEMIRQNYPRVQYQTPAISNFFYDTQKRMNAFIEKQDGILRVNVLDVNNETVENVFNSNEWQFTNDPKENIEWSPSLYKIIIPVMKDGQKNYFLVDTDTKQSVSLQELAETKDLSKVRWDSNNRNYIYYISESKIYRLNINDPQDKKVIAENAQSYDLSGNKIFYFQSSDGIVYSRNPESSSDPIKVTDFGPEKMTDPSYQITVYDERRIAFLNKSGDFYVFNDGEKEVYFRELGNDIKGIQFSDDGKKLLFWNDWEISAYYLRAWEVQPFRSENDKKEITRFSEKIDNVQWSKDYEHVIFSVGKVIKIIEIDHRDQKNLTDISSLNLEKTKIVSDFPDNKLYFIDQNENVPYLNAIAFPEDTTLF
jgi:hypothetical protein